ncbi:hypothetical protein DFJ74DRAFT_684864 [Hyaloraphidium curvatum]|nr:hypothetical protein DFJ74DRAFT_684864 [Hyaloraphidium curvatum]
MPANLWSQLASFFFVMSAVFTDLLLLRVCLVLANMFLVVHFGTGIPVWPEITTSGGPAVDSVVWASIALALQLWALVRLFLDEWPMKPFAAPNDEALYRFFNLRTGISRVDFVDILGRGEWVHVYERDKQLPTEGYLYILVDGAVECTITDWRRRPTDERREETSRFVLGSGDMFDLKLVNVFSIPVGFYSEGFEARSASEETLLFAWPVDVLADFATKYPPVVGSAWRNLIAFSLADVAHAHTNPTRNSKYSPEDPESAFPGDDVIARLSKRHADFDTRPETRSMKRRKRGCWPSTVDFFSWIVRSMDPRPPKGIRHYAVPAQFVVDKDRTMTQMAQV